MPERTILRWDSLSTQQPLGELDVSWLWQVVVGASNQCDVVLMHPTVDRRAARFVKLRGEWWIEDLASANGVFVDGRKVSWEKVAGRRVLVAAGGRFSLEQTPMPPEELRLREAILAAPDDDARLHVYADWLQEQGDELGRHMVAGQPAPALWLGPLFSFGTEVKWRQGFFDEVTVRSAIDGSEATAILDQGVFGELFQHPLAAFLRVLRADLVAIDAGFGISRVSWLDLLCDALLASKPRALSSLKLRLPVAADDARQLLARIDGGRARYEEVRRALPRLSTTWEELFTDEPL